jgi:SAM-dependent methyltransferase
MPPLFARRLGRIKKRAVEAILENADKVPEAFYPTVCAFPFSYSIGRNVVNVARSLGLNSASSLLIVGASGGRDFSWLSGSGYCVDVLDLGVHAWAKRSFVGNASDPGAWAPLLGRYDLVVLCDVLEHLPEDFQALCHIRSALKPGGALFLSLPFKHDPEPTHVRSYSMVTLERLLRCAGFRITQLRFRPGLFEAFPRITNLVNYGIALLMPSVELGASVLKKLLQFEYVINKSLADLIAPVAWSVQYGVVLVAESDNRTDYVGHNYASFISDSRSECCRKESTGDRTAK